MLEEFQFTIGSLRQYRCTERFHDLLDSNGLTRELILGRASSICHENTQSACCKKFTGNCRGWGLLNSQTAENARGVIPDKAECTHSNGLQIGISACDLESRTEYLRPHKICHVELRICHVRRNSIRLGGKKMWLLLKGWNCWWRCRIQHVEIICT